MSHPDDYDDNDLQYMYTDVLFDFLGPGRGRGSPDAGMMHPDDDDDDDEFNDKINPPDRAVSCQPPFFPLFIVKFIVDLPCTIFPNSPYIWEKLTGHCILRGTTRKLKFLTYHLLSWDSVKSM